MGGASDYVKDRWNVMDFFMNSLYLATISTKICAYMKHMGLSEGFGLELTSIPGNLIGFSKHNQDSAARFWLRKIISCTWLGSSRT